MSGRQEIIDAVSDELDAQLSAKVMAKLTSVHVDQAIITRLQTVQCLQQKICNLHEILRERDVQIAALRNSTIFYSVSRSEQDAAEVRLRETEALIRGYADMWGISDDE